MRGRRSGPRPVRRRAGRAERAAAPFPGRDDEGLGLEGDRVPDTCRHRVRVAATAAAAGTATRCERDPRTVFEEVRDGLCSRERARATSTGSSSARPLRLRRAETARLHGRRMSYRVGIDVGGTFTDFLVLGADDVRIVHKTSSTPDDPSRAVVDGPRGDRPAARLGAPVARRRRRRDRARHDGDDERGADPARRADRPARDEGLPRRPRAPRRHAGVAVRQPTAASHPPRAALPAPGHRRANRLQGRRGRAARRGRRRRSRGGVPGRGSRGGRDLFHARAAEPGARAARARAPAGGAPGRLPHRVERAPSPGALLRADIDDGTERVRRADHHELPRGPHPPPRRGRLRRRAAHHAIERGSRVTGQVSRRAALSLLSGPASGPTAGCGSSSLTTSATASRSTWAERASTRRSSRTASRS